MKKKIANQSVIDTALGNPENRQPFGRNSVGSVIVGNSPALIKASVYLLAARPCPHGLKSENLMREWAAQGKLFSFHVDKARRQANKHLHIQNNNHLREKPTVLREKPIALSLL